MGTMKIPPDFKEFLRLLNVHGVRYLLVGGYAVGFHGYVRTTGDLDIWVEATPENVERILAALQEFGFSPPEGLAQALCRPDQILRMGVPPMRIEILTSISGVEFGDCHPQRVVAEIDGVEVSVLGLSHLRINKKAAGRHKDLDDLEHLHD